MTLRLLFILLVAGFFNASSLHGEETNGPEIISFSQDGKLTWVDALTTGTYRVEWTSSLNGEWRSSFDSLTRITPGFGNVTTADVPMFYRVVRVQEPAVHSGTQGVVVGFGKIHVVLERQSDVPQVAGAVAPLAAPGSITLEVNSRREFTRRFKSPDGSTRDKPTEAPPRPDDGIPNEE